MEGGKSYEERLEYLEIRKSVLVEELESTHGRLGRQNKEIRATEETLGVLHEREGQIERKMEELRREQKVLREHLGMHEERVGGLETEGEVTGGEGQIIKRERTSGGHTSRTARGEGKASNFKEASVIAADLLQIISFKDASRVEQRAHHLTTPKVLHVAIVLLIQLLAPVGAFGCFFQSRRSHLRPCPS